MYSYSVSITTVIIVFCIWLIVHFGISEYEKFKNSKEYIEYKNVEYNKALYLKYYGEHPEMDGDLF